MAVMEKLKKLHHQLPEISVSWAVSIRNALDLRVQSTTVAAFPPLPLPLPLS